MKTKITLLFVLLAFAATSCVTDYEGSHGEQTKITDENTMYEGDVYRQYLNVQIDELDKLIKELGATSPNDPNFDEDQEVLEKAKGQREKSTEIRNGILSLEQAGLDIKPPCPDIIVGDCVPRLLANLLFASDIIAAQVRFLDEDGEVLNTFSELERLEGFENKLSLMKIELPKASGTIEMIVDKLDDKENPTSYSQLISQ